jgi:hypothetical protein
MGTAFAEQLLFQNERGAVGTYGSTGFEYLTPNNDYMSTITRVWFYCTPYDTMVTQTQAEWQFGQLMFLAEAELVTTRGVNQAAQPDPVERYHILGEPDAAHRRGSAGIQCHRQRPAGEQRRPDRCQRSRTASTWWPWSPTRTRSTSSGSRSKVVMRPISLTVVRMVDPELPHARQYRLSFRHRLQPRTYDIVLRAYQAPDTTAGQYHMVAEFVLKVESSISVSVNGRPIQSGAAVPADGNYRIDLEFPGVLSRSRASV